MSFTKITNSELNSRGATTLPNQPTISALALKQEFDAPAKNIVAPKFNNLIDELEASTSAGNIGAQAPAGRTGTTAQGVINSVSSDLATVEAQAHTHSNKSVIDKFADNGTGLTYDGSPISGAVDSVNGYTGTVVLDASDVGALPDSTTIPTKTSDLNNDSGFVTSTDLDGKVDKVTGKGLSTNDYDDTAKGIVDGATAAIAAKSTVTWTQNITTGQKIATVSIDGTPTDVYAPTGGGGGGGAVDSVNGQTGTVVLDLDDINDTSIASLADQDTLVYNGTAGTWGNEPLADVALTGSYANLTNTPTIPDGLADLTDDVAISSPSSGQILQHNGTKWANANMPSIPDGLADLTDDVNITSPSNDQVLKYDGSSSKWINGSAPASGHTMLPDPTVDPSTLVPPKTVEQNAVDAVLGGRTEGYSNDDVPSLNTVGYWSNTMTKTFEIKGKAGSSTRITQSGIGTWPADPQNPTAAELETWIPIRELYGIWSSGDDVHFKLGFHLETVSVPITLGGYYIDDNCTMSDGQGGTIPCGRIVIKFGNEIPEADTHTAIISVEMTIKRTDIIEVG